MKLTPRQRLWRKAEEAVLAVRGSYDVPGFDACVWAEFKALKAKQRKVK